MKAMRGVLTLGACAVLALCPGPLWGCSGQQPQAQSSAQQQSQNSSASSTGESHPGHWRAEARVVAHSRGAISLPVSGERDLAGTLGLGAGTTYSSADSEVASVGSDGVLHARAVGKTTVTAKTKKGRTERIGVKVLLKGKYVAPSSLKVSSPSGSLSQFDEYRIKASLSPESVSDGNVCYSTRYKGVSVSPSGRVSFKYLDDEPVDIEVSSAADPSVKATVHIETAPIQTNPATNLSISTSGS